MKQVALGLVFATFGLTCGAARQAAAATAAWSEEMSALPGANWGGWDDFDGRMKNDITLVDLNGNPGTGAWKRPLGGSPGSSYGMVWIDPVQNIPLDVLPSMSGPGLAQYTAEIRYRVNTPLPASGADGFDVMWFNVGGGWLSGDSGPDIRMTEGVYLTPGSKEESFYAQWSAEGFKGSNPNIYYAPASDFAGTTRGEWHTLRLIQDEVNDVQEVYIDSTLISTVDISSYDRSFTFTRGLAFGAYGIDVPPGEQLPEVLYDYIRVADGVVPIGVAINAPGGAVFDEADFNQDGAVNAADLAAWSANFGRSAGATKAQGDSNADGRVNGIDFLKWQQQFGRSGGAFAAVPEPSTALTATLLASALLARRKRAAL